VAFQILFYSKGGLVDEISWQQFIPLTYITVVLIITAKGFIVHAPKVVLRHFIDRHIFDSTIFRLHVRMYLCMF